MQKMFSLKIIYFKMFSSEIDNDCDYFCSHLRWSDMCVPCCNLVLTGFVKIYVNSLCIHVVIPSFVRLEG